MNRKQYAEMMHQINAARENGGDVEACVASFREKYKYVYVYNDSCFKKIFGSIENRSVASDFLNAVLKFDGDDCISIQDFVDPSIPGGPFVKSISSDIVAKDTNNDRIVIEVQHKGDSLYKDRLVFYRARHTLQNKMHGDDYELRKMYFIALQLFDSFPNSGNYRHCVQLKDDDNHVFFEKDSLTIVEIKKFHKNKYVHDFSPLAEWLRAVERVNNEDDSPLPGNRYLEDLQSCAKLCNFDVNYLVNEAKAMTDREYELSIERKEAQAKGREEGRAEGRADALRQADAEKLVSARNLIRQGVSKDLVIQSMNLTEEQIKAL